MTKEQKLLAKISVMNKATDARLLENSKRRRERQQKNWLTRLVSRISV